MAVACEPKAGRLMILSNVWIVMDWDGPTPVGPACRFRLIGRRG